MSLLFLFVSRPFTESCGVLSDEYSCVTADYILNTGKEKNVINV